MVVEMSVFSFTELEYGQNLISVHINSLSLKFQFESVLNNIMDKEKKANVVIVHGGGGIAMYPIQDNIINISFMVCYI